MKATAPPAPDSGSGVNKGMENCLIIGATGANILLSAGNSEIFSGIPPQRCAGIVGAVQ